MIENFLILIGFEVGFKTLQIALDLFKLTSVFATHNA